MAAELRTVELDGRRMAPVWRLPLHRSTINFF